MARRKTNESFYTAMAQAAQAFPSGPLNLTPILKDFHLVLDKAFSLHDYQDYLARARSWKAARRSVASGFEHEVQAQASQALADVRELTAATLRTTRQFKQTKELDRILDTCISGIKASGQVQILDLWTDVENDLQARQMLREQGMTDALWTVFSESMSKIDGRLFIKSGKLAAELKMAGQEQTNSVVFSGSGTRMPRTVTELLRRGLFEHTVERFDRDSSPPLGLNIFAGEASEVDTADAVLGASILSVQMLARHKRKLEDTGLATYAGGDPISGALLVMLVGIVMFIAGGLIRLLCGDNATLCSIGDILMLLGLIVLTFGAALTSGSVRGSLGIGNDGDYFKCLERPDHNCPPR